jgi:hypothetical protein
MWAAAAKEYTLSWRTFEARLTKSYGWGSIIVKLCPSVGRQAGRLELPRIAWATYLEAVVG